MQEQTILDFFAENKEWIFNGVGALFLMGLFGWLGRKLLSGSSASPAGTTNTTVTNNINVGSGHNSAPNDVQKSESSEETQEDTLGGELDLVTRKALTRIVFVDDDVKFKIVQILKKSGWINTSIIKDVANIDEDPIVSAHIVFVDIRGVGKAMDFKDEGLGLALALKKKYSEKYVVIYSTQSQGNRFHEALRQVDTFVSKNAEPYEFQEIIEQASERISLA